MGGEDARLIKHGVAVAALTSAGRRGLPWGLAGVELSPRRRQRGQMLVDEVVLSVAAGDPRTPLPNRARPASRRRRPCQINEERGRNSRQEAKKVISRCRQQQQKSLNEMARQLSVDTAAATQLKDGDTEPGSDALLAPSANKPACNASQKRLMRS